MLEDFEEQVWTEQDFQQWLGEFSISISISEWTEWMILPSYGILIFSLIHKNLFSELKQSQETC